MTQKTSIRSDITSRFSKSSPELQDLLTQMLEVNPYFRPSAKQLMQHKIFDSLRQEIDLNNTIAPFRIMEKIDLAHYAINYE